MMTSCFEKYAKIFLTSLRITGIVSTSRERCSSCSCRVISRACCCRCFFRRSCCGCRCSFRLINFGDVRSNDHPVRSERIVLFLTRSTGQWALVGLNVPIATLVKMKLAVRHQILASSRRYKKCHLSQSVVCKKALNNVPATSRNSNISIFLKMWFVENTRISRLLEGKLMRRGRTRVFSLGSLMTLVIAYDYKAWKPLLPRKSIRLTHSCKWKIITIAINSWSKHATFLLRII